MDGERLKTLRLLRGWTLQQLATALGTTPTQLSRLENGKRRLKQDWIVRISAALGVDVGDLSSDYAGPDLVERMGAASDTFAHDHRLLDYQFFAACFESTAEFYEVMRNEMQVHPMVVFKTAHDIYGMFYPLFLKDGSSPELIAAMKAYIRISWKDGREWIIRISKPEGGGYPYEVERHLQISEARQQDSRLTKKI